MEAPNPKRVLLQDLERQYRIRAIRGPYLIALDSTAILYIRHSNNAGPTKSLVGKFWFGVTKSEYDKYRDQNLFVVCMCVLAPGQADYVVFPADRFEQAKEGVEPQSGQWKFYLLKTREGRYRLRMPRKGEYDVTDFLNYLDFSPPGFRRACLPQLGRLQPMSASEQRVPPAQGAQTLEQELLSAAKDSAAPERFEIAVEKFLAQMGFRCTRIGGPGNADIVVTEPVRFVVDAKSTKARAKSAINFARIKRHMRDNNAELMLVVSVAFEPAVARDAEMEGVALIDVQSLAAILSLHREHVFSPFDFVETIRRPGIVGDEQITILARRIEQRNAMLRDLAALLENLDFRARSVDEIRGRTDLFCEQTGMPKIPDGEMEGLLHFLCSRPLGIAKVERDRYSLLLPPPLARERLKRVLTILSGRPLERGGDTCES